MRADFNAKFKYIAGEGSPYQCWIRYEGKWIAERGSSYQEALTKALARCKST